MRVTFSWLLGSVLDRSDERMSLLLVSRSSLTDLSSAVLNRRQAFARPHEALEHSRQGWWATGCASPSKRADPRSQLCPSVVAFSHVQSLQTKMDISVRQHDIRARRCSILHNEKNEPISRPHFLQKTTANSPNPHTTTLPSSP